MRSFRKLHALPAVTRKNGGKSVRLPFRNAAYRVSNPQEVKCRPAVTRIWWPGPRSIPPPYTWLSRRPRPSAMNVRTSEFKETPSALARVANWAFTVFGARATNFPEATSQPQPCSVVERLAASQVPVTAACYRRYNNLAAITFDPTKRAEALATRVPRLSGCGNRLCRSDVRDGRPAKGLRRKASHLLWNAS